MYNIHFPSFCPGPEQFVLYSVSSLVVRIIITPFEKELELF